MTAPTYPKFGSGSINVNTSSGTTLSLGTGGTISLGAGGGGGYAGTSIYGAYGTAATFPVYPMPVITPNEMLLNDSAVMNAFIDRVVTTVDRGKQLVICVNDDCSPDTMNDISGRLADLGVGAMVIRGARAGYGYPVFNEKPEDKRVDMLARIGELWEQRPDLRLTDLFQWYAGADMEDEDFVKCTEVHFKKMSEM